jgi:predicted neuraminidase
MRKDCKDSKDSKDSKDESTAVPAAGLAVRTRTDFVARARIQYHMRTTLEAYDMVMGLVTCILMHAAAVTPVTSACDGVTITQVIGPEFPGEYKHPASIAELDNGDLFLAYYGGSGEYGTDTKDFGMRLAKGSTQWTTPEVIADTPWRAEGNPVVWQAPDGIVWLFYVVRYGDTWSDSRVHFKISRDGAHTWSDSYLLTLEAGILVRSHPLLLKNGDLLLPVYKETGHDKEIVGTDTASFFLRRDGKTGEWSESNRIHSRLGNLQPAVAAFTDDYLVCYCRRAGTYEPTDNAWVVRAESHDAGRTWSDGKETTFPNPNAAVDFLRLKSGHLLLVYNDSMNERTPLTVAISTDDEKTWKKKNIAVGDFDYAYPYAIQAKDGKIHIIFTSHERKVINHAVFDEDAFLK